MIDVERLVRAAKVWYDAGCSIVPAAADGTKRPYDAWKQYQTSRASWPVVQAWLTSGQYDGFGIVCGTVSGGLEMFEIEGRATDLYDPLGMAMIEAGYADLWHRLCIGYREQTPSGGFHWLYRVEQPRGNMKLARRPADAAELEADPDDRVKVLIETRGEGGFTIVAPSGGRTHPAGTEWERIEGSPAQIPVLTADERDALHAVAATFDRMPVQEQREHTAKNRAPGDPLRPGDDFNLRGDWQQILVGWTYCFSFGIGHAWRRPGKDEGISATTGRNDGDNLYVFSSSTPFETEKPYSKFGAYTLLHHGGDFGAAAKALHKAGYGERHQAESDKPDPFATAAPSSGQAEPADDEEPASQSVEPESPAVTVAVTDSEAFWTSRPELEHIRQYARSRLCSPYSVLGVVLARVLVATPQWVVLPPIIGGHAPLNLFVALVGRSGAGKGASENVAAEAVDIRDNDGAAIFTATIGSGEGIAHMYAQRIRGGVERVRYAVLFSVPEIDNMDALGKRQGATLMPQIRSGWSGETLGFGYADKDKALRIERFTYRMGMILGVQPGRAQALLDDADGGTPQRFLWMPTGDRDAPSTIPATPERLRWTMHGGTWVAPAEQDPFGSAEGLFVMPLPDVARDFIIANRQAQLREDGEALNGHALQTRTRVAAALALLAGRKHVEEADWEHSAHVMEVSDATRQSIVTHLSSRAREANKAKGEAEGQRAAVVADRVAEEAVKRVARRVLGKLRGLGDLGQSLSRAEVRRVIAARDRQYFDEAVDRLVEAGQVVVHEGEKGDHLAAAQ